MYLCNQGGVVSPSHCRLAYLILSLTSTVLLFILAYIPTHLSVEEDYLWGSVASRVASSPSDVASSFSL